MSFFNLIDVDTKRAVFAATTIETLIILLCIVSKIVAWIMFASFALVAGWTAYILFFKRKEKIDIFINKP